RPLERMRHQRGELGAVVDEKRTLGRRQETRERPQPANVLAQVVDERSLRGLILFAWNGPANPVEGADHFVAKRSLVEDLTDRPAREADVERVGADIARGQVVFHELR